MLGDDQLEAAKEMEAARRCTDAILTVTDAVSCNVNANCGCDCSCGCWAADVGGCSQTSTSTLLQVQSQRGKLCHSSWGRWCEVSECKTRRRVEEHHGKSLPRCRPKSAPPQDGSQLWMRTGGLSRHSQVHQEWIQEQKGALYMKDLEASSSHQTETECGTVTNGLGELYRLKWHECQYSNYRASKSLANHGASMVFFICFCKHQQEVALIYFKLNQK